jgi:hypothetical protein
MNGRAQQGLLLPFIPAPYPDEVLGSWLSRIRVENGGGAWRAFLEHVGYGRRLQNMLFDVTDYNEKLSLMLALLGTTYERALLELSTLPYWLTFSASDSNSRLSGTTTIPAVEMTAGGKGEISSIKNLGSQRTLGKSFEPRYCPKCIPQDFEEVGQSYWHRAHQLPNVLFCHKHYCKLQVECPACGIKLGLQSKNILPLPTPKCQCGFSFERLNNSQIPSAQELRLINISVRALDQRPPSWQRNDVLSYLRVQLARGVSSPLGQYQRVLSEAFPARTKNLRADSDADREQVELRFRPYLSNASAPECCGLLAALDIDFDIAIAGFRALAMEIVHRVSRPKMQADTITVKNSRAEICRFHKLYPKRPISYFRRHYWYLRLYDSIWLQEQFFKIDNAPIPTIAEDRTQLEKILSSVNPLRPNTRLVARLSPAGLRATIRDGEWFSEQQTNSKCRMASEKIDANISILSKRANAMRIALEKILSSEERPIRVHASILGALVGLSISQAESVVRSSPVLREAIAVANADKIRRQILWAARQLTLSKGRLSKKQLGRVAGVPTAQVSDEIFAEVKALHYRESYGRE